MERPDLRQTTEEQAAFWFLRLQADDVFPEEIEEALAWRDQNPAHREAFARVETVWHRADGLPASGYERPRNQPRREIRSFGSLAAAVAVTAIAIVVWHEQVPAPLNAPHIAAIEANTPAETEDSTHPEDGYHYESHAAENRTIALQDGSEIVLGGASVISVNYSPSVRRINLVSGEAYFHVAKDAARPFIVDAGAGEIRAVGTQFDVHRGLDTVTVAVVEGAVRVSSTAPASAGMPPATQLVAGHQLSYSPKGSVGPIQPASVERTASWRDGELTFVDRSLADVVGDLNRYSARPIQIDDDTIKAIRITGMVTVAKMDDWLHALEKDMPVQLVMTRDVLLLAKKGTTPKN